MSLIARLEQEYLTAYKAKDTVRVNVLRLLKTALKNFQVQHLRPPTDEDAQTLIIAQCKQRQDAIEQFTAANRPELADKESAEMAVLRSYLPPPLEGEELNAALHAAVASTGATGPQDMGKVMKTLLDAHKGRIDGKRASDAVKALLQELRPTTE